MGQSPVQGRLEVFQGAPPPSGKSGLRHRWAGGSDRPRAGAANSPAKARLCRTWSRRRGRAQAGPKAHEAGVAERHLVGIRIDPVHILVADAVRAEVAMLMVPAPGFESPPAGVVATSVVGAPAPDEAVADPLERDEGRVRHEAPGDEPASLQHVPPFGEAPIGRGPIGPARSAGAGLARPSRARFGALSSQLPGAASPASCEGAGLLESVVASLAPAMNEEGMAAVDEDELAESSEGEWQWFVIPRVDLQTHQVASFG
jgi:hypothetical protein